jgi:hypothetical protein
VIVAEVIAVIVGTSMVLAVLISALETVVLPMRGFTRIARFVFAVVYSVLVHHWRSRTREIELRGLYAPIALVTLPLVWMSLVAIGFSLIFWGLAGGTWVHSFEVSGSSLTTLGFSAPVGLGRVWLAVTEAIIGLGLVALLITYLPTIYAAHHSREKGIMLMRPFAGTPPSPVRMILALQRLGVLGNDELWRMAANWILELDQTHSDFPALCYFPESVPEQSWVGTAGCVLDAASLVLAASDVDRHAVDLAAAKGPLLVLTMGIPAVGHIGRAANLPVEASDNIAELLDMPPERADQISIRREEFDAALDRLSQVLSVETGERDECWRRFAAMRSGYDRALRGLAGLTLASPAPWTTDRPARVGRPRPFRTDPVTVDWTIHAPLETPTSVAGA